MVCLFIWNRRNKCRVKEAVAPLGKLSDLVKQHLQEFQVQHGKSVSKQPPKQSVWKPPDPSALKTILEVLFLKNWEQ